MKTDHVREERLCRCSVCRWQRLLALFLLHADGMVSRFVNVLEALAAKNQYQDNQRKDEETFHAGDCIAMGG